MSWVSDTGRHPVPWSMELWFFSETRSLQLILRGTRIPSLASYNLYTSFTDFSFRHLCHIC